MGVYVESSPFADEQTPYAEQEKKSKLIMPSVTAHVRVI
jgi:hypothetical protein